MTKLKVLSVALIAAATLATPAMARETHVTARHLAVNANASTAPGAQYIDEGNHYRGYEGHDVWGHWGTYYGPCFPQFHDIVAACCDLTRLTLCGARR